MPINQAVSWTPGDLASKCRDIASSEAAVVYEARGDQDHCYPVEFTRPGDYPELPLRGPLARWPRVNGQVLQFPSQSDVLEGASPTELQLIEQQGVRACAPMLAGGSLVGLVLILDSRQDWQLPSERSLALLATARQLAPRWRNFRGVNVAIARARAEYRSQQLSVAGELAASAAHEIRNPLSAVRSLVQFVRDTEPTKEDQERLLGNVLEEVDRVNRTVGNLLHLARPQTTLQTAVDLKEVLYNAIEFIEPYARKRKVRLNPLDGVGRPIVVGDPHELRQVLVNILLNACQACVPGGEVWESVAVITVASVQSVEITIRDNGQGIEAADVANVCEPFFTTKTEGTGLGLAICKDVMRRHHGHISVTSARGKGTSVLLRLPMK